MRKSVCAMFRNLEFTSGSVDCNSGFVRMCFENVFQCHVLHDIRISVLHLDCIGQWGSRLCACAIRMLFLLQVFKQFFLRDRDRNRWTATAQSGATLVNVSALVLKLSFHK